jgi:hypothetical protein
VKLDSGVSFFQLVKREPEYQGSVQGFTVQDWSSNVTFADVPVVRTQLLNYICLQWHWEVIYG